MTVSLTELVRFVPKVARDLGVDIREGDAWVLADRDAVRITMRMPWNLTATAEIDGIAVMRDNSALVDSVYTLQSKLFAQVAEHMRQHNHDPHNRLTQLTELVGSLVKQLDSDVDLRPHEDVRSLIDDVKALLRAPAV